jgi:hypothetical protein
VSQLIAVESMESIAGVWLAVDDLFWLVLHDLLRVVPMDAFADADLPETNFSARLPRLFRDRVDESEIDEPCPRERLEPDENIGLKIGGVSGKV